jgi:hypothetical protein
VSRAFAIDFTTRRWRMTAAAWLFLLLTAAAAAAWFVLANEARRQVAQASSELAALQRTHARATNAADRTVRGPITPERARSVNDAIRRLNLPWDAIFNALNAASTPQVALLALEPDASSSLVRLTGETKTTESMLALQHRLEQQENIVSAVITKHEVRVDSPGAPVRFWLEAKWEAPR